MTGKATIVVDATGNMEIHMQKGLSHSRSAVTLYLMLIPAVSMAYFDPGSGAFMVQTIFTLIGAALFYARHPMRLFRLMWKSIRRVFRNRGSFRAEADAEEHGKLDGAIAGEEVK